MTSLLPRVNLALLLALLLSCFWLVDSSHESRRLFIALDRARAEASELQIEFERLQVDKRAQATPLRVEKLSREKLKMFDHSPARTHYVVLSESGKVVTSSPARVQEVAP